MDAIDINVGEWYLLAQDPDAWANDRAYSWSVCAATTAEVEATITLLPDGTLSGTAASSRHEALTAARDAVSRFAADELGLTVREA